MDLASRIEGVLFYRSEPVSVSELSILLETNPEEIRGALTVLATRFEQRGISFIVSGDAVELRTSSALHADIEKMRTEELKRDIGKAGAETLAIILYHDGISRADIDYIRGVNSTFIIRNLLMRGLIERSEEQRTFIYRPTIELLAHLGVSHKTELPQFAEIHEAIRSYKEQHSKNED